jgi:acetylornithine/N-succinyldiaminopimelate aminotransferase
MRRLSSERGAILIFDEVQCGMGRTGRLFAHEWAGVTPDIMAVAKAIGGGFPMGACLATESAAAGMKPGTHGSTYGGNPLAMAVGNAVLDVIQTDDFLPRVRQAAARLQQKLGALRAAFPHVVEEVRGEGLLLGLKCRPPNTEVVAKARDERLLLVGAGDNVVRILPPLIVSDAEIDEGVDRLSRALAAIPAEAPAKVA